VDVDYVAAEALQHFRTRESPMALITPGEPFHLTAATPDWLISWYLVREYGVALVGPPPSEFISAITLDEFVQGIASYAEEWGERVALSPRRQQQAYAVLTMCRALYTCTTREHTSKTQAARWAQRMLPEWRDLIERATGWRRGDAQEGETHAEVINFVREIRQRIRAIRSSRGMRPRGDGGHERGYAVSRKQWDR
jgi:hypothetical protein